VGRLAIEQFLPARPLVEQIGVVHSVTHGTRRIDVIPLPHPSGASTWPRTEPGKTLTARALALIGAHAGFRRVVQRTAFRTARASGE
jgi:uracil-DNA glycosylase